ncbi:MAG TPA: NUDIX hydrolase [Vicinamibacterales bacterium]
MTVAPARPASTVVLIRPSASRFEVFLVRRHENIAFMGGVTVFPGGRVDAADNVAEPGELADRLAVAIERMDGIRPAHAIAHHLAASRELSEESGVRIDPHDLTPFARWVTPEFQPKRFDAWFFLAIAPAGQAAAHDGVEHSHSAWIDPAEAIEMCRRDEISLAPPTWTTLRKLSSFASVEEATQWAVQIRIVRVQPAFVEREGSRILMLPGDPLYPAATGFEVPPETRFVMRDGRWTPVNTSG